MIRFFDFGETVGIPLIELKLKMIPRELLSVPQLAYRCSLPIFPPAEGKWDLANPYVTVFQDLKNMDIPIVIIAFARVSISFASISFVVQLDNGPECGL